MIDEMHGVSDIDALAVDVDPFVHVAFDDKVFGAEHLGML